jgi:hypothetical protein
VPHRRLTRGTDAIARHRASGQRTRSSLSAPLRDRSIVAGTYPFDQPVVSPAKIHESGVPANMDPRTCNAQSCLGEVVNGRVVRSASSSDSGIHHELRGSRSSRARWTGGFGRMLTPAEKMRTEAVRSCGSREPCTGADNDAPRQVHFLNTERTRGAENEQTSTVRMKSARPSHGLRTIPGSEIEINRDCVCSNTCVRVSRDRASPGAP